MEDTNNQQRKILNAEQVRVRDEFMRAHGLDESQIGFEGDSSLPIFDYEAINTLSLKLTDIQNIEPTRVESNDTTVTVYCSVTLPDGRTRGSFGSCEIGEALPDSAAQVNRKLAEAIATSRAFRRGIRSVGINLVRAHDDWMKTGNPASAHTNNDPRAPIYQELNALAYELGLKSKTQLGENRAEYERVISEHYDGRTSAKDLNDLELNRLVVLFRTLKRLNQPKLPQAA